MGTISKERIDNFNPVTDVLDKILRDEDIKQLQQQLGIQTQDGVEADRITKLNELAKYLGSGT